MKVVITPSKASGCVCAPPSKSMAHRALICGALAGNSTIHNLAWSQDGLATLGCLQSLGCSVEQHGDCVKLGSFTPASVNENAVLECNESGSTLRFMLPLCLLCDRPVLLRGSRRLLERPLGVYESICSRQGIIFERREDAILVCGRLRPGHYSVPGNVSSQFITGLLFTLPLLDGDSTLEITGTLESASYIELTLSVMRHYGIKIDKQNDCYLIPGRQTYTSADYTVEGDCSNAAFLEAFNYIGGDVQVDGLAENTQQGDRVYKDIFASLAAGRREFDLSDCPDLAPVLFSVAAVLGCARFTGTARLRIKESDRGAAMAAELAKFGITVRVEDNLVDVLPSTLRRPVEDLWGHNDHRIVMALSLLCSITGGTIDGAQAVAKSYPDFFDILKVLQIGVVSDNEYEFL